MAPRTVRARAPSLDADRAREVAREATDAEAVRLAARRGAMDLPRATSASRTVEPVPPSFRSDARPRPAWLLVLDEDTFGALVLQLLQPLYPSCAGRLSRSCHALRDRLAAPLEELKQQHNAARRLCVKAGTSCTALRDASRIVWSRRELTDGDVSTLAALAGAGFLEKVKYLGLPQNRITSTGAEALAAALAAGRVRRLQVLDLSGNRISDEGRLAIGEALVAPRALLALVVVNLLHNGRVSDASPVRETLDRQVALARTCKRLVSVKGLV